MAQEKLVLKFYTLPRILSLKDWKVKYISLILVQHCKMNYFSERTSGQRFLWPSFTCSPTPVLLLISSLLVLFLRSHSLTSLHNLFLPSLQYHYFTWILSFSPILTTVLPSLLFISFSISLPLLLRSPSPFPPSRFFSLHLLTYSCCSSLPSSIFTPFWFPIPYSPSFTSFLTSPYALSSCSFSYLTPSIIIIIISLHSWLL